MVNLVTIENQKYLVDVGFGADGPCQPIPLISDFEAVGNAPQGLKLRYTALPNHTDHDQRAWVYSHRENGHSPWVDAYALTEIEFFPEDFEVMNLATMTLRQSFFIQTLFCVKMLLDLEANTPAGVLILYHDQVKKRVQGELTILEKFENEQQRVDALERWFGIRLSEAEQRSIQGLPTELKGWKLAQTE
jgi:arylamine N-acetyltransferase